MRTRYALGLNALTTRRPEVLLGLAVVFLSAICLQTARAQTLITFVADPTALPTALNSAGQIVGSASNDSETAEFPFEYSNGAVTNLGILAAQYVTGGTAVGISNAGVVVGNDTDMNGNDVAPFIYANGKLSPFGAPGAIASIGASDAAGDIVGVDSNEITAFIDKNGSFTNLTAPGLALAPAGVNSLGNVVGSYTTGTVNAPESLATAFFYSGGKLTSLNSLGGTGSMSMAAGINNSNEVVGHAYFPKLNANHAFAYENGVTTDLGTLIGNLSHASSEATGINNAGEIVGYSTAVFNSPDTAAFIYSPTTGMENLNTLYSSFLVSGGTGSPVGFTNFNEATAINDSGDIAGIGDYWDGTRIRGAGFLLDPAAVPEARSWILGMLGVLAFWQLRRARA